LNGDGPLLSLDPSADGVSYPPVLHALKITTIVSVGATSIDVIVVGAQSQNFSHKIFLIHAPRAPRNSQGCLGRRYGSIDFSQNLRTGIAPEWTGEFWGVLPPRSEHFKKRREGQRLGAASSSVTDEPQTKHQQTINNKREQITNNKSCGSTKLVI
jgi:hypothetical protein